MTQMQPGDPLSTGHLLDGRYRIKKVIGAGGMGRVYLGNDTRLANRPVAVKEMTVGDAAHEQKALEDFAREARVLAMLSHPGIPNIIDYFTEGKRHYLVMEFVAGGDLQHLLDQFGPGGKMPEAAVLRWSRQILDVLEFLHAQHPPIIYRDLKPGNIMIDKDGRAMLVDFGIARFLPPGGRGTQIGSVGYAPPEQYMGKIEPRSDLYSLAATMHHLLTGRDPQLAPPFSFPPVGRLAPEVSAKTEQVVMRALDKDLNQRPASAGAMRLALPDPGPAQLGILLRSGNLAAAGAPANPAPASPLATMATVVLKEPARESRSGSASVPRNEELAKLARMPTQSNLAQPAPSKPSPSSTTKTQELKPVAVKPSAPGRTPVSARKAAAPALSRMAAPPPSYRPMARPAPPMASGSVHRSPPASNGAASMAPIAGPAARLIARTDGTQFRLAGGRTVLGRSVDSSDHPDIDLATLKRSAPRVSRRHAEIILKGGAYFIRDLGSLNGTYIAGLGRLGRDQLYRLKDRDEVVLGDARLEFREG